MSEEHKAYQATWESLGQYTVPQWYQDGKFGIFIHWGLYAVPAFGNEWYPRNMYQQGSREFAHHVATYGRRTRSVTRISSPSSRRSVSTPTNGRGSSARRGPSSWCPSPSTTTGSPCMTPHSPTGAPPRWAPSGT